MKNAKTLIILLIVMVFSTVFIDAVGAVIHLSEVSKILESSAGSIDWSGEAFLTYHLEGDDDMVMNASCDAKPHLALNGSSKQFTTQKRGGVWTIEDKPVTQGNITSADGCTLVVNSAKLMKLTATDPRSFFELLTSTNALCISFVCGLVFTLFLFLVKSSQ